MLQNIRGTSDFFGNNAEKFDFVIKNVAQQAQLHCFESLQIPIIEYAEVFLHSIGESSDIVSKEIYSFLDKSDKQIALRPEFTAGIVRAILSNNLYTQTLPLKFFSHGPLFRYERPQKGRRRQFHQINFEIFHKRDDNLHLLEILSLANNILQNLGIKTAIQLQINCLGDSNSREKFSTELQNFLNKRKDNLSPESQLRLQKNPLRILDSKSKIDQEILQDAPKLSDFLSDNCQKKFTDLQNNLRNLGIDFVVQANLVRGLDYYSDVVFEFVTDSLGAQNAILAGGCYNNLVSQMSEGKTDLSAVGFAGGIERIIDLIDLQDKFSLKKHKKLAILPVGDNLQIMAMQLSNQIRNINLNTEIIIEKNLKKQLQTAVKRNFSHVIIVGQDELDKNIVIVRDLQSGQQNEILRDSLLDFMQKI